MKKKLFIISLLFMVLSSFSGVFALNVVLSNQNPDPVNPGSFVYLNVKLTNPSNTAIQDAIIEIEENQYFKIASGSEKVKELGIIPAGSSYESSNSYTIAKYKVYVDPKTPQGLNTVKFNVETKLAKYTYEFEILVEETNPKLTIESISTPTIEAGENGKLIISIENKNSIKLKNIIVNLDLNSVDEKAISTLSGSNQILIEKLESGEKKEISFDILASPKADSIPYILPINIEYEDFSGNLLTQDITTSISVYSKPEISVKLDSQEIYTKGSGKFSIAIANPGTSTIKGTEVEVLESENYEIMEGKNQYIGNLNPDDFQTAQIQLFVKEAIPTTLKIKLTYTDSYNKNEEQILDIPLKILNEEQMINLGLSSPKKPVSEYSIYIVFLIILVLVYIIGRKRGYSKGKKSRN